MAAPRRVLRLQRVVHEVTATTLQREVRDPRLGFVTVTRVRLARDLTEAHVYWSILGTDAQRRTSARALHDATPLVQAAVAKALATRTTPAITFRYDPTLAKAERLEGIFETLKQERGEPDAEAAPPDSAAEPESDDDEPAAGSSGRAG